jgi:hypothetical protein
MSKPIKDLFVTYEIGKLVKDKGFNENCFCFFRENGQIAEGSISYGLIKNSLNGVYDYEEHQNPIRKTIVSAPLWTQVINWLSDVHNIEVDALRYTYSGGVYKGKCYMWFVDQYDPKYNYELEENDEYWILNHRESQGYDFEDKTEAIKEGIIYALTLI